MDEGKIPKLYFKNLDGLRFILALIVFFGHSRLGETLIAISPFDFLDRIIRLISAGDLAVSFFFTLSGFLITFLIIDEKENTQVFNIWNFYIRRILRIWPLFYLVLGFTFFIYPVLKVQLGYTDQNPYHFFYQAFFLSNFDNINIDEQGLVGVAPMMISINWSIAIEEQFYLFWPLLFLLTGARRFWIVIVSVIIISMSYRTFLLEGHQLYYHTLAVVSDLGIGALLAYMSFYYLPAFKKMERQPTVIIVIIYICGFGFLMYLDSFNSIFVSKRILTSVFFAFIITEQNFAKWSFYKFGNSAFLTSLAKYTYSFYLLHPIGIQASIIMFKLLNWDREDGNYYAITYVVIAFLVTMTLSLISYQFVESFFLKVKSRFYSKNPKTI